MARLAPSPIQRILIGLLILANIGLIVFLILRSADHPKVRPIVKAGNLVLPTGEYLDATGRTLDTTRLLGSPVYVQFVNSHVGPSD